jgi:hypothetical protein
VKACTEPIADAICASACRNASSLSNPAGRGYSRFEVGMHGLVVDKPEDQIMLPAVRVRAQQFHHVRMLELGEKT